MAALRRPAAREPAALAAVTRYPRARADAVSAGRHCARLWNDALAMARELRTGDGCWRPYRTRVGRITAALLCIRIHFRILSRAASDQPLAFVPDGVRGHGRGQ